MTWHVRIEKLQLQRVGLWTALLLQKVKIKEMIITNFKKGKRLTINKTQ